MVADLLKFIGLIALLIVLSDVGGFASALGMPISPWAAPLGEALRLAIVGIALWRLVRSR